MVTAWGGIAQLGERLLCKQEVSGSIPLASTTILPLPSAANLRLRAADCGHIPLPAALTAMLVGDF